jgi:serine/threonine-protein kinase HipA
VGLAPLYDLLSTVAYPDLSAKLAMKIAKKDTLEGIGPATWSAFSEDAGLAAPFVRRRVKELADAIVASAPRVAEQTALASLDHDALSGYASVIVSRAERVARTNTA